MKKPPSNSFIKVAALLLPILHGYIAISNGLQIAVSTTARIS